MQLTIKNWDKFQHYKSGRGAPPWIKLHRCLLNDKEWHSLDSGAAKFLISVWMLAAEYDGKLPDIETLAFRLRCDSNLIAKYLHLCSHWIISDASEMLASCYQVATPDTETETETEKKAATKSAAISLQSFLDSLNGARAIDSDDPIFAYCEKCGISEEMLNLCWLKFKDYYLENPSKKYKDWRKTFRNCVKDNWYGIWWFNADNKAELSNKGRQAAVSFKEAA